MSHDDKIFARNFSWVMFGLIAIFILILILGAFLNDALDPKVNTAREIAVNERIKPAMAVFAGDTGQAALLAQQQLSASGAAASIAFGGSTDGEMIYNSVCSICHTSGIAGSPKLETSFWVDRIGKGVDELVLNALEGFQGSTGVMPAKGGRPDLNEEQIRAVVDYMLTKVQ